LKDKDFLLQEGRLLPVMEEFYSIQGEGHNTGQAAYFLRIGGCDVCCAWCDIKESWNAELHPLIATDTVIENIIKCPAKAVVVTGGEPLNYNLDYLCSQIKKNNILSFLETSGSQKMSGLWDWICLSPKKHLAPLHEIYNKIHELKVIIQSESDFEWAEQNAALTGENTFLFLQPEWKKRKETIPLIIGYIMKNPKWKISLQSHKYMGVP